MVTYALFACSALLATIVCFGCRYLVNASAHSLALPGVTVESTQADGRRITYALDGTATAGDLVRRLAEVAALRDISVLEPAIEDVVARLYTRQRS
jgi:ABC-type uncharacterized transport system ATPase subunit